MVVAGDVTVNAELVPAVLMHGVVTDAVSHAAVRDIGIAILDTTVPCCVFLANTGAMADFQPFHKLQGRNAFMQKRLPPAFSNSVVSTTTGVSPSCSRIVCRLGVR